MFTFSTPNTKCNITVGYISSERGFVDGVGIHEANKYAKLNPGTQFIFKNRDFVKYLNINEVNALVPDDMLPSNRAGAGSCSGIVGLNLEGDTSKSIDESLGVDKSEVVNTTEGIAKIVGGSTQLDNVVAEKDKKRVSFYGGGGVGVHAAPIIGIDGSVLAVQVIHGGYGYKYPPIVDITDDTGKGGGVVAKSIVKTQNWDEAVLVEEFDREEDYEEYVLDKCVPEIENVGYGQRWGPDGKNLGKWDPNVYFSKTGDPIKYEIQRYQQYLNDLQKGSIIENGRIKGWWTTRKKSPLRITSSDKVTREKFDVQHWAWGGRVTSSPSSNNSSNNNNSNNKNNSSNNSSLTGGGYVEASFIVYTSGGHGRGLKFTFTAVDDPTSSTVHSFQIKADSFAKNKKSEEIKIKVKRNTKYNVVSSRTRGYVEQGLLKESTFGKRGIEQDTGTGNSIFTDLIGTNDDDDDLQIQTKTGTFTAGKRSKIRGNDSFGITYEFKDSDAFKGGSNGGSEGASAGGYGGSKSSGNSENKKKTEIFKTFMNQYAISPQQPSNVAATDQAGKTYTFEWEEDIPWDGDYIFNIQADNEAHLYVDNDPVGDKILLGSGGAAGHTLSPPTKIKKHLTKGMRKIQLNLLNHQIKEMVKVQKDVIATSDEVTFTVTTASLYANGFEIPDLGISIGKEYGNGKDIRETITKKVEYGRVYPVKFTSSNQATTPTTAKGTGIPIVYKNLNPRNNPIKVRNNRKIIDLVDGSRNNTNASIVIDKTDGGEVTFTDDGRGFKVTGTKRVLTTITLVWSDHRRGGYALDSFSVGGKTWTRTNRQHGSETKSVYLYPDSGSSTTGGNNSSRIKLRNRGEKVIEVEDIPGTDAGGGGVGVYWDDIIISVNNGRLFGISGNTCSFTLDAPVGDKGGSTLKGERAHVFNSVDWIKKANRKLWKMNPSAGKDSNFINRFGILPFDPTEVAKIEKKVKKTVEVAPTGAPPRVKFEVGNDGKNYLKVIGNGRVKVGFEMDVDDGTRGRWGWAVREVKIKADDGEVILKRSGARFEKLSGTGTFSSGKKYLIKSLGGSRTSGSKIGVDKTLLQFDDAVQYGFDGAGYANVKVKSVNLISTTKEVEESVLGYPNYPSASTEDYAGFHEIIWNNITFPESGNYAVAIMVDDNAELKFTRPNKKDIVITKQGFSFGNTATTYDSFGSAIDAVGKGKFRPTGKSVFIKYFESGTYTLNAVLEQIPGGTITQGNVMGLAIDIKAAFISNDVEVVSAKSWNENPMGVAMTIDAPLAPPPKQEIQKQEGRCPNNPIWTTRSSADETWYPVNVNNWAKFMNRYAISPLPPLGVKGTDGAGTVFRNSWKVELPYKGYYGVKGTADNFGRLFIDGVEVLGPDSEVNFDSYKSLNPKTRKIFLEKKTIDVTVEVENEKQFIWNTIDQKVFSTADWASKQNNTSTTIEGVKNVDVTFKVSSASLYANNIEMQGVFSVGKEYGNQNFNETYNRNIEVGKVYDVIFTSNNQAQKSSRIPIVYKNLNPRNNPIKVRNNRKIIDLVDGSRNNTNASIVIDKTDGGEVTFTDDGKGLKVTGGIAGKRVKVTITLVWSDNPRTGGVSLDSFSVADKTWTRTNRQHGNETKDVYIYPDNATYNQNNNANIRLRNKGKGVVQMEDWTDNDWVDIMASATDGEFYNMVGNTCKYRIPSKDITTIEYGKGLTGGSTKDGVSYSGPPISTYVSGTLGPFLTPTFTTDEEYIANFNGKTWTMTFNNVDFPEKGTYDIQAEADDVLLVKVDGIQVAEAEVGKGITKTQFNATKGKRKLELVLMNIDFRDTGTDGTFRYNPTVAAVKITRKVDVAKVDPRSGTAQGKPWTVNPLGVSAILIPPPCPKKIDGVGIVTSVIITDPGNGFDPPLPPERDGDPSGPSVILELDKVIPEDQGINYGPDDKVCIVNTETGEEICYIPPKGPLGEILEFDPRKTPPVPPGPGDPPVIRLPGDPPTPTVTLDGNPSIIVQGECTELVYTSKLNTKLTIDKGVGNVPVVPRGTVKVCPTETTTYCITGDVGGTVCTVVTVVDDPDDPSLVEKADPGEPTPPNGFREYPKVIVRGSGTGIGYKGIPLLKTVLDPIGVDPKRLIQVTDLPGLKQTGYYDGKPYYGAIFYENGIRYAGYYDTPGQKVQIYATLLESIDARVTTPPSAIQRQGTDINSNNPRLNIPGTPDNLT